jgi:RimJ/RimL family protein N-acetyltransferase
MIETERLLLRPFCPEDLDILEAIYCDGEILTYTPFDVMNPSQVREHLSRIVQDWERQPPQSLEFVMVMKENGEKIGRCHILIDPECETGMIGWLLRREYRGRHYARESGEALIDYCFDELGLHRVNAVCNPENLASRRVLEHCGLRLEACLRQKCRYIKQGAVSWHDELEYALLASERRSI